MRILVTDGAGFIGSVVAAELTNAGHQVVVYDNLSHGFRAAVPERTELVVGDVADSQNLLTAHPLQSFSRLRSARIWMRLQGLNLIRQSALG